MRMLCRIGLPGLSLLFAACATTSMVGSWRDPEYSGAPFRQLLVVGITKDPHLRRSFEDIFSAQLRAGGVRAVPSYSLIQKDGPLDQVELADAVRKSGVDGVITTRVVNVDTKTDVSPGYTTYFGAPMYPYAFYPPPPGATLYGYYTNTFAVYQPPTTYTYDEATLETSLFEARSGKLMWSGTTVTFDIRASAKASADLARIVIESLIKDKLI
jgi:hypothetical protein